MRSPGDPTHSRASRGWSAWLLLLTVAATRTREVRGQAGVGGPVDVDLGAVGFKPISYLDVEESPKKWWFWLIIGIVAAFLFVLAFFAWRGFKQWRLYKQKQAEEGGSESSPREHDEQAAGDDGKAGAGAQAAAAAPGKDAGEAAAAAAVAAAARGGAGDIELGLLPPVPGICSQPVPGQPVSEAQAAYLRERERRTAVHPRRRW